MPDVCQPSRQRFCIRRLRNFIRLHSDQIKEDTGIHQSAEKILHAAPEKNSFLLAKVKAGYHSIWEVNVEMRKNLQR